jgi:hypothetical protein
MPDFTPDQMRLVTDELDRARAKGKVFGIETERVRILDIIDTYSSEIVGWAAVPEARTQRTIHELRRRIEGTDVVD